MLDLCLPGTGGMLPLEDRWLACCFMEYQGKAILIDCGEGTQIALKKAARKLSHLEILLVTHFHADHIAGLPGLLLTLGNQGKTTPLIIVGPAGLEQVVSSLLSIAPNLPFDLKLIELKESIQGDLRFNNIIISYLPLNHGISCFGYGITIHRKPIFNPQKAKSLKIPVSFFRQLHSGQSALLEDGRIILPEMVLDGERNPIKVCYCTDTIPMSEIIHFAYGADLFICEGMYGNVAMGQKMYEKGHMIFSDSARIAKEAKVKRLWLTHYSPAMTQPEDYLEETRKIFSQTFISYDGIQIIL